jgi:hypothetical protein
MSDELTGYLELEVDEDMAREVGYYVLRKMERDGFDRLSHPEQVIGCLTELEMEVNNGGFDQYYWNSPGDHALETVDALRELGAGHTASLLVSANAAFGPEGPSRDRDDRGKQMDGLPGSAKESWSELDRAFDEYRDNLSALAAAYIRAHRSDFSP